MISVDQDFQDALQQPIKRVSGYLVLQDGTEVEPDGDLKKFTINATGDYLKTAMSEIKATLIGQQEDLADTMLDAYYGVFYDDEWHWELKGKFNIIEAEYKKGEEVTEIKGYDNMVHFAQEYFSVGEYPSDLKDYLNAICSGAGVGLETEEFHNDNLSLDEDLYAGVEEYTFRDVLEDICEVTGTVALINPQGDLELREIKETEVTLYYNNLTKYKTGDRYGSINSLVLSRQPQNDNIFIQDEEDINRPTTRNIMDLDKFNVTYSAEEA